MGCFPCFNTSKKRKEKKAVAPTTPSPSSYQFQGKQKNCESLLITVPTEKSTNLGSLQKPVCESRGNSEGQLINGRDEKTKLDVDVDPCTDVSIEEVEIHSVEKDTSVKDESGKMGVLVEIKNEKEREHVGKEENGKLGVLVETEDEKEREKEVKEEKEHLTVDAQIEGEKEKGNEVKSGENGNGIQSQALSDSSVSSYISYPPMHRYHNCLINEEDEDDALIQQESSDSLFSLPNDSRKQSKSNRVEVDDKEVNSPLKISCPPESKTKSTGCFPNGNDHTQRLDSALIPIENLSQWKTLKVRSTLPPLNHQQEKENVNVKQEETSIPLSEEPNLKSSEKKEKPNNDIVVTTSLSSWLIESEKAPTVSKGGSQFSTGNSYTYSDGANSWKSFEDRPILGALTVEEVRQISARSSPRKSPCRNPDEMPIIGTVGSYWSHTGQATDSSNSCSTPSRLSGKSRRIREDKVSSCHSAPFSARLEKALDKVAA